MLLNLISNGFYAASKRKEMANESFVPTLKATTKSLGNQVEIRIRDNGSGIPLVVKEKMFIPFFTTKPTGEGSGLGLSISHDIVVKQHGGTIDVDTESGLFTEFIITLPRTALAHTRGRQMLLDELVARLTQLPEKRRTEAIDLAIKSTATMAWVPNPGPQTEAFVCEADELFYGGETGGGKTASYGGR